MAERGRDLEHLALLATSPRSLKFAADNAANPEALMTPAQVIAMLGGC